jgi:GDPmannose 4,6-dehydratase
MQTALIFGAGGQDGHYLAALCKARGIAPVGCSRSGGSWLAGDVADRDLVESLVRAHRPDFIFQLAARSTTRHDALFENHTAISTGTLNVLEAARMHAPAARIFLPGSGVMFKNDGHPISERNEFAPSSPYAVARIYAVQAGRYFRSLGLRVYVGHLFHHESPLRQPGHVSRMVADAARRAAGGDTTPVEIGDIRVEKEWTFAGDTVAGMFTLLEQDDVFEAAIGSGIAYSIERWLETCFAIAGRDWRDHVKLRGGFVPEYRRLVADPATMAKLGWSPKITLEELAAMMMSAPGRAASA